ncbi:Uncharacterized protein with a C-terminal OMP (outer membrane protein) domain [Sebaldella termitidis]|uniref:Outer membrane autotransporter barrel domain protein n=1 Tax=Sebaldella termitidis (strain ATCC 33386 / NCTC 11300) TaxID=526218 RepID=D1ARQ8_SEBTE|nr:autotransporter domain-containing protein [Sebaldella termitidis]ACZ10544.1 outer membrane autotransporter barrel domain protein [Sebaldella termitidis ATCC 33386]SUI25886.1 Uncharacterized protein with a C-terminal OMP (outer membrane protein) domain [Sebaldella termitidis]
MKRNKKLLVSFLALNAILTSYAQAETVQSARYERMYNGIVKNLEKGSSNEKTYQTIEKILNQKNKELKDLYLQGDYIVKPEYLEWQVFFTGFYEEYNEGVDNSKENAKYHSKVTGYYDDNGNYVVTSGMIGGLEGKPHKPLQQPKEINLGVSIPIKGMTREPLNLSLSPAGEIVINPNTQNITPPTFSYNGSININEFSINLPSVDPPTINPVSIIPFSVPDTGNTDEQWVLNWSGSGHQIGSGSYQNAIIAQQDLSGGTLNIENNGGTYTADIANTTIVGKKGSTNTSTANGVLNGQWLNLNQAYILKIVGGVTSNIDNMEIVYQGNAGSTLTKPLFFTDAHNNGNRASIWSIGNATNITLKGENILLYSVQSHGSATDSGLENSGTIVADNLLSNSHDRIIFNTSYDNTINNNRYFYMTNNSSGLIELDGLRDLLVAVNVPGNINGGTYFTNDGEILLNGVESKGAILNPNAPNGTFNAQINNNPGGTKLTFNNPLKLRGDGSIGLAFLREINLGLSKLNLVIGDDRNKGYDASTYTTTKNLASTGNLAGNDSALVEDAIGIYYNVTQNISTFTNAERTLENYDITFGDYAKHSTLVRIDKGDLILGNSNISTINIGGDSGNFGFVVTGSNSSLEVRPDIQVGTSLKNSDNSIAAYAGNNGEITFSGTTVNTYGIGAHAFFAETGGTIKNNATILNRVNVTTVRDETATLFADGGSIIFNNGGDYKALGDKSLTVYADNGGIVTLRSGVGTNNYEVNTNGVLFYKDNLGEINIDATGGKAIMSVGDGSVFAISNGGTNKINFLGTAGDLEVTLKNGSTGFIFDSLGSPLSIAGINSALANNFSGLTNLDMTLDAGSRLFVVENYGTSDFSAVSSISLGTGIFNNVFDNGGKGMFLWKGVLKLDGIGTVNLDNASDPYFNVEKSVSGVEVDTGYVVNGTKDNQIGFADINPYSTVYVKMTNNGIISLTGKNTIGFYTDNGEINNNSTLNITGQGGLAIFGENDTKIKNTGTITIGDAGIGIYGISYQTPSSAQTYGNGKIDIENNGTIIAGVGSKAIGVYANNNKTGGILGDAQIKLLSGIVDVSASDSGIGVYVNKGTVTDLGSTITVGKNGVAFYAKDSHVTLTGTTINLFGDNSLGIYLDGVTNFNGSGDININGKNIVLFNMNSSGIISNNFNVTGIAPGSTYTIGNIVNGSFNYTGSSILSSNGVLVSGQYSSVFLNGSTITVNPGSTNVAAIALDGQAGTFVAGMSANTDGENNGTIILENVSVGLYGKNGARLKNTGGTITVGDQSAGIMTSGAGSTAVNTGIITVGSGSQGITLKDGADIINDTGAGIFSSGINSVGIYADNVTAPIINNGTIQLLGDKSIGIFTKGASVKAINNTGLIEVGNSSSINDPSIGIFSENAGDVITNTNTIKSGINSIGIYSAGGTVIQNGVSDIGNTGVGIYSTNGTVNVGGTSVFNFGTDNAVGVYAINSAVTNNATMNIGSGNYGFVLTNGTFTGGTGSVTMGSDSVYVYRSGLGTITNGSTVTMSGSDNIGFYIVDGGEIVNNANITGTIGNNNVGIYNVGGKIDNTGTIAVGASDLIILTDSDGVKSVDVQNSKYAVGVYGENSVITNQSLGNISIGYGSIGVVAKKGSAVNDGAITGTGDRMMGMYSEGATVTNNGTITLVGDDVIGMAGNGKGSVLINSSTGVINVSGQNAIGMYGNLKSEIINAGTIIANGPGAQGIVLSQGSTLDNTVSGTMIVNSITSGNYGSSVGTTYPTPSIINSGVIKVSEKFETDGINVVIKVDPSTVTVPTASEVTTGGYDPIAHGADYLISNATSIEAPSFNITNPLQITGNFAEGTNVKKYKLEDVIIPGSGNGIDAGLVPVVSKSLTWRATPVVNNSGNVDIWMEKIDYDEFTDGLWYEDFGRALDDKYFNAQGDALKIYDKIDVIETESDFRHVMASLAGNVYANINQREYDIAKAFEESLHLLQDSTNNTKENVKISVIAGKGKNKEETDGVTGYDYTTTGVLALREVERTYKHTFGYSLGYVHTGFEFKDGNESEEWVDTIQLGVHNKYRSNGWKIVNDLTGRASIHNVDRNIDWPSPLERSEMNGTYETYSITSDNILGKEFGLGKKASIMPYGAFRAMYVTRPTFNESGLEALEVEGNDAWSAKPRAGVELKGAIPLGAKTAWQLKGTLDLAYEYELADLNEREKARLIAIEDGYHKLSKPEDEKGTFRTRAAIGVEVEDRYGIFLTGEYSTGNDKENDYRAGVTLKAVF